MNLQVIASPDGNVMWVSGPLPGSAHDKKAEWIWVSWPNWRPRAWSPSPIRATREARTRKSRTGEEQAGIPETGQQGPRETALTRRARERPAQDPMPVSVWPGYRGLGVRLRCGRALRSSVRPGQNQAKPGKTGANRVPVVIAGQKSRHRGSNDTQRFETSLLAWQDTWEAAGLGILRSGKLSGICSRPGPSSASCAAGPGAPASSPRPSTHCRSARQTQDEKAH
jgi:hypothetical protein